jgi:acetate kinase
VGHRIVHGGTLYAAPVRITPDVLAALTGLIPLAPLHQPHNLTPIRVLSERLPQLPQVACFDTQFHSSIPPIEQTFALPQEYADEGVRRYGFHGLSYEFIAGRLAEVDAQAIAGRTIVLHLGNGSSACALRAGSSVATTMGMTALDGLVMGTRSGSLDPGVLLYLMRERGMDDKALATLLYERAGLLGVSGVASDMRALAASSDPRARFAIELFCYRATREIGALAAVLGGVDALVFTGGIGEHAPDVRARIVAPLAWLGFALEAKANAGNALAIGAAGYKPVYVIPTNEELMIARHTRRIIAA